MRPLSFFEKFVLSISALLGYFKLLGLQKKKDKAERKKYLQELKEQKIQAKLLRKEIKQSSKIKPDRTQPFGAYSKIRVGLFITITTLGCILFILMVTSPQGIRYTNPIPIGEKYTVVREEAVFWEGCLTCYDVYNIEKICQKNDNGVFIGEICTPTGNSTLIQQSYPEYRSIPIRSNYNNRRPH